MIKWLRWLLVIPVLIFGFISYKHDSFMGILAGVIIIALLIYLQVIESKEDHEE